MLLLVVALADFIVLTVDHIPFTRPYVPGHAKLRARWPLYLFGSQGFAWGLTALELLVWNEPHGAAILLAITAVVVVIFELAVRHAGTQWSASSAEDAYGDPSDIIVLDLGTVVRGQARRPRLRS